MTIDEAISEFKERAEDSKKISELGMKSYIPKAKEEEQLAEWLEELKELRKERQTYIDKVVAELKDAIQNGVIKLECGNEKLFDIVKAGGKNDKTDFIQHGNG